MLPAVERAIPDIRHLGQAVQELREEKGLKKEEFALAAGVDVAHLSRAQNHGRNFTWETLTAIAKALDVSISELVLRAESVANRERPAKGPDDDWQ